MLFALVLAAAQAATPFGGVEYRPLSRADLGWLLEDRTSGLAVGEFDGTVIPPIQGFGGVWLSERTGVSLSLGVARLQNTTNVDGVLRQRHWGVVRPGVDIRWALTERVERRPFPWVILGGHGTIPSARDVSTGYTKPEQKAADEQAYLERARLGGLGARFGLGADYEILPGLGIGAQWSLAWHRGLWTADDLDLVTSWLYGDASLILTFRWPEAPDDEESEGAPE